MQPWQYRMDCTDLSDRKCKECKSPNLELLTSIRNGNYQYQVRCRKCGASSYWNHSLEMAKGQVSYAV